MLPKALKVLLREQPLPSAKPIAGRRRMTTFLRVSFDEMVEAAQLYF